MGNCHEAMVGALAGCGESARPGDCRVCEEGDTPEGILRDELAAKLVAAGCAAREAPKFVEAVFGVIAARESAALGGLNGVEAESLVEADRAEALRQLAYKIVEAPKPRFTAGCLVLAAGFRHPAVKSARQWAAAQDRSHEHASNEVEEWQGLLKLPRTADQKSDAARKSYGETNGAGHKTRVDV